MSRALARGLFLLVFFVSGFAALLYQIIWQRILTFFGGADLESVTIIVSAFMAGLGLGSLAGGHLADRLGARGRVLAFAGCELAVAMFAVFSTIVYYDLLYVRLGAWALPRAAMAAIIFLVTLWPTTFMGMSLPLAARVFTDDAQQPARWVPLLYGWNTLGAACGSLFSVAVLFRSVGLSSSLVFGAVLSVGCALAILLVAPRLARLQPNDLARDAEIEAPSRVRLELAPMPSASRLGWWAWLGVYAMSGFVALSLEIVWFRILGVIIKSSSSTFGYLLATYLAGVGLGALVANHSRMRAWRPAPGFLLLQAAIPAGAALSLVLFVAVVGHAGWAEPLRKYMAAYEGSLGFGRFSLMLYGALPFALIGPSTLMMGMSFGLVQRAVQSDLNRLGRRVGWLQTASIVAGAAGTMLTGLLLLDRLGATGTLQLLAGCGLVFLWLYGRTEPGRRGRWVVTGATLGILLIAYHVPHASTFWARLHAAAPETVIQAEDGTGLSVLKPDGTTDTVVYTNGLGQSKLPYGGIHTVLGALPALLHLHPASVAVIGLGSGDTLFAAGGRPETREIDCIEIVAPELDTLRALNGQHRYPGLGVLLRDERVRYHFTDGRAFLRKSNRRYDIIEADALRPNSAYSGNLYSVEYFELLRDRLNPGGLAVTWVPTERVRDTIVQVFPYVLLFDEVAMGSTMPLSFDRVAILARMQQTFTREYYSAGGIDLGVLLARYLLRGPKVYGPDFDRTALTDLNRDLFPKDEFGLPYKLAPPVR